MIFFHPLGAFVMSLSRFIFVPSLDNCSSKLSILSKMSMPEATCADHAQVYWLEPPANIAIYLSTKQHCDKHRVIKHKNLMAWLIWQYLRDLILVPVNVAYLPFSYPGSGNEHERRIWSRVTSAWWLYGSSRHLLNELCHQSTCRHAP